MSNFSLIFEAFSFDTQTYLFTPGFRTVFLQFNLFCVILIGFLAIGVFVFVINAWVVYKTKDIAIMKATGMLPSQGYSIFMAEILILTLVGYFIGCIIGFSSYLVVFIILEEGGFHGQFQMAWVAHIIFLSIALVVIVISGGHKLTKILEKQTVGESLAGDIPFSTYATSKLNFFLRNLSKIGTSVKIAIRNLSRRRYDFNRTFGFLSVVGMLLFITTIAPISLNSNVQGYLQSAINQDTIVIGHEDLAPYIVQTYAQFSDASQTVIYGDMNFSRPDFFFHRDKMSSFQITEGIEAIDACTCLLEPFREMPGIRYEDIVVWDNNVSFYIRKNATWVGENREGVAVIMGINTSNAHTLFQNNYVASTEMENITIGDGIQAGYTEDYSVQKLEIHEKEFWMSNVVMDPGYNGRTVYMGIAALWDLWEEHNNTYNLIFVRTTPDAHDDVIGTLDALAKIILGPEFTAMSLRAAMRANAMTLYSIQTYFILITFIILGIAIFAILEYHKGASHHRVKDLFLMRMLGATRRFQMKCYYWETLLMLLPSLGLAFSLGMLFVEWLLVSDLRFLPPLWVPLSITALFFGIFSLLNYFVAKILVGRSSGGPALIPQ